MSDFFADVLAGQRVMAILRGMAPDRAVKLAERAWDLGIELVEVTVQTPDALESLAAVVEAGEARGKLVGAGTVTSVEQLTQIAGHRARFAVAPGLDLDLVQTAERMGMPYLPGVATPSEVQAAAKAGLTHLKAFPASVLGPDWFRAMAGPFPNIKFVATGGLEAAHVAEYLKAGAVTVGVGSALEHESQLPLLAQLITGGKTA